VKLVAIPDLHLSKSFNVTYGDASLMEEHPYTLVKRILEVEQGENTHFIFLGDVFNTDHPSFHSIFKFLATIEGYSVTIISGNHDIPKIEKKSVLDYLSKYGYIVLRNAIVPIFNNSYALGWCDTQEIFVKNLTKVITKKPEQVFLHAGYNKWENEMDNVVTDSLINLALGNRVKLIAGHEHVHNIKKNTLYHLGSVMPLTIGELGKKYYWTSDKGLVEIKHKVGSSLADEFIITRDEIKAQGDKPILIRKGKVETEDLVLEKQEFDMDILDNFKMKAIEEGFTKAFLKTRMDSE